ncbi:hypothetical protein C8F01DRAFT_1254224 [Mycena amicta]|nr:hypothetical protein C8F01DRAFT_1254224 [Mycena amicta]
MVGSTLDTFRNRVASGLRQGRILGGPHSTYRRHIFLDGLEALRYSVGSPSELFLGADLVITEVQRNESYICLDLIIGRPSSSSR